MKDVQKDVQTKKMAVIYHGNDKYIVGTVAEETHSTLRVLWDNGGPELVSSQFIHTGNDQWKDGVGHLFTIELLG